MTIYTPPDIFLIANKLRRRIHSGDAKTRSNYTCDRFRNLCSGSDRIRTHIPLSVFFENPSSIAAFDVAFYLRVFPCFKGSHGYMLPEIQRPHFLVISPSRASPESAFLKLGFVMCL